MKILDGKKLKKIIGLNKRLAEDKMPLLLDMLVKADSSTGSYLRIPKNDDVALSGLDGKVTNNTKENHYVPIGDSYWEIGTGEDFTKKVYSDFEKRNNNDDLPKGGVTFISITCKTPKESIKNELIKKIKESSKFKDFIIYDATDLANWLNSHINVLLKFFEIFNETYSLTGIELLETYWKNYTKSTEPNLNEEFIVYFNNNLSNKIVDDLKDSLVSKNIIKHISSKRYGKRFGLLFTCASIMSSKDEELIGKGIIVKNQESLDFLLSTSENLILLLDFNCFDLKIGTDINNTIVLFTNYDEGDAIKPLSKSNFVNAIKSLGINDEKANRLSYASGFSYSSLIRKITINPMLKRPIWANNINKHELVSLMLIGTIDTSNQECLSLLKKIISIDIDDYIDCLINWGDLEDSPVVVDDTRYNPSCRSELFDYINIDINNTKLRKLEDYLAESIVKGSDNDLICDIIDGFLLLNEKGYYWENHFLRFSLYLIERLEKETGLKKAFSRSMYKVSALSPAIFIRYLKKIINSNDVSILESIMKDEPKSWDGSSRSTYYLLMCLEKCMVQKELVVEALELLLALFDKTKNKQVEETIEKVFSPISSVLGITFISAKDKTNILFSHLDAIDDDSHYNDIISCFSKGGKDSFFFSVGPDSIDYSSSSQSVPYSDVFLLEKESIDWLFAHVNGEKMDEKINTILNGLYSCDDKGGKEILKKVSALIDDCKENDSDLAVINKELLELISHIEKYNKGERIKQYSDGLYSLYEKSTPANLMFKYRFVFESNDFPIVDSSRLSDDDWFEKDEEKRNTIRQNAVKTLFDNYKEEEVIDYLINTCKEHIYAIWNIVFEYSTDKLRDCKKFILNKKNSALSYYLSKFDICAIESFINELSTDDEVAIVISCLPLTQEVVDFISKTKYEKYYWKSADYYRVRNISENIVFEKLLEFNPLRLLSPYAYIIKNKTYDRGIRLLKAVVHTQLEGFFKDEHYSLERIVEEMDALYYNEELSEIEIQLLPYLKQSTKDYPLGIKRLFWLNPFRFVNFLKGIYTNKSNYGEGSVGKTIYYETEFLFGFSCFIPKDYLTQNVDELNKWFDAIMDAIKEEPDDFASFVKKTLSSIFSNCPSSSEAIWPTKAVADLMEKMSANINDPYDLSSSFFVSFVNRRGAINVDDGTAEFALEQKYRQYAGFYSGTHKVTSKALYYIADSFKSEGENFKRDRRF